MEIEPVPKVTFLPAQLTALVIKNWTGEIIDYEKNGQICKVYHGQGTCEFKDGHKYKGELQYGLLHGKGTFTWTDGTVYQGEFTMNEITGLGSYKWPDGSVFEGTVKNGLRDGNGKYINDQEGVEYEGQWLNGMRHGQGTLTYKNGSVYEGDWHSGMKCGKGKMTYSSGNYYEGEWDNNKRNGMGTMHWLTSDERYEGNWEDNFQSGFGTHIWLEGSTENKLLRNRYIGYWKEGQRSGKGIFYYSNGSMYEGEWFENLKHGQGVFTFEDGTQYIGAFDQDRMVDRKVPISKDLAPPQPPKEASKTENVINKQTSAKLTEDPKALKENSKGKADTVSQAGKSSALLANNQNPGGGTTGSQTTGGKFAGSKVKKEVEENPYKKLVQINDLMEFEENGVDTLKEVHNVLLRFNSELKAWYREYSRKIEVSKSEESFAMNLRQVWRFMRDTQLVTANSTLAQFNRVYSQGPKNHFKILSLSEINKFSKLFELQAEVLKKVVKVKETTSPTRDTSKAKKGVEKNITVSLTVNTTISPKPTPRSQNIEKPSQQKGKDDKKAGTFTETASKIQNISDDEEEDNQKEQERLEELDDIHNSQTIVLPRQFFEAVIRACYVKFSSGIDSDGLNTLAQKLEFLFKNNLIPYAIKNKSKTIEQVKTFKLAEKVFEDYQHNLQSVFNFFSSKKGNMLNGRLDVTLKFTELLQMLKIANILPGAELGGKTVQVGDLTLEQVIFIVEKYYAQKETLNYKLSDECFENYLQENPHLITTHIPNKEKPAEEKVDNEHKDQEGEEQELEEEQVDHELLQKLQAEKAAIRAVWSQQILDSHILFANGIEMIFYEFIEILLELAIALSQNIEASVTKPRTLVKKFLDEVFLYRINPYIRYAGVKNWKSDVENKAEGADKRDWPFSQKDKIIIRIKEERERKAAEEQRLREEAEAARLAELQAQLAEQGYDDKAKQEEEERKRLEQEALEAQRLAEEMSKKKQDENEEEEENSKDEDEEFSDY